MVGNACAPAGLVGVLLLCAVCLGTPGVPPASGCTPGDLDADLADYGRLTLEVGLGLDPACRPADLDGDVNVADAGLFQHVFTGPRGGGSAAVPPNPYLFTGRRVDFDLRDTDGSITGQPGRPLLVLYDYRARAYDPWHGRFCQRDPAALPDADVCSIARRALAIDELERKLTEMLRMGISRGPSRSVCALLLVSLDGDALEGRVAAGLGWGQPNGDYAVHLDSLNLYQYARCSPAVYVDPDGQFSLGETLVSAVLAGLLGTAVESPAIMISMEMNNLSGGQVALLYVTAFFTNAASALGPFGTAGGSLASGVLTQWITNWSFKLDKGDIANILVNTGIGFASGWVAGLRGAATDWPDSTTAIAAAELSSILNSVWGWVTPW